MGFPQFPPVIFNDHKSDTTGQRRVKLGIMEPAVHMYISLIVQRPFRSLRRAHVNRNKINCQHRRNRKEADSASEFGSPRDLVHKNQTCKYHNPAHKLPYGCATTKIKHFCRSPLLIKFICKSLYFFLLPAHYS